MLMIKSGLQLSTTLLNSVALVVVRATSTHSIKKMFNSWRMGLSLCCYL